MYGGRRGVVALLYGETITGKTLAVQVIASRLNLPILHVDLFRVVSKYIGETEKNLDELFECAEESSALLFLRQTRCSESVLG